MQSRILETRENLLSEAPYFRKNPGVASFDPEALLELEHALVTKCQFEGDDGRVAVALGYHTYPSQSLRDYALRHDAEIIQKEMQKKPTFPWNKQTSQVASLINGQTEQDLAKQFANADGGWLVATCSLLTASSSALLDDIAASKRDPSNSVLAYLLISSVQKRSRLKLLKRLVSTKDDVRNAAALELTFEWMLESIDARENFDLDLVSVLLAAYRPFRNTVLGLILERLMYRMQNWNNRPERLDSAMRLLNHVVFALMDSNATSNDIQATVKAAQDRAPFLLAAMAESLERIGPQRFDRLNALAKSGEATLELLFGSTMHLTEEEAILRSSELQSLLHPLAEAFSKVGIDSQTFNRLYYGLAMDRYSRDHRYSFWLRDRPKALALIAVGLSIAQRRKDLTLMENSKVAAFHASQQPSIAIPTMSLNFNDIIDKAQVALPTS